VIADDLPDLKLTGIPRDAYSGVSEDAMRRVAGAFPDVRLLWNNKIQRHQCVFEEPGCISGWITGEKLVGWRFMAGDFPAAMSVDEIIGELRRRQEFNMNELRRLGFEDAGAYVDHLFAEAQRKIKDDGDALADDVFAMGERDRIWSVAGMTPGQCENMNSATDRTNKRTLDLVSGRRDLVGDAGRRSYLRRLTAAEIPNLRVGS